jgi:hypothetical protein
VSSDMIKAIEKLEQGHEEMRQSMTSIATQQAVQNENIKHLTETIKTSVIDQGDRLSNAELKLNTHGTYWKIAGWVLTPVLVGFVGIAFKVFG